MNAALAQPASIQGRWLAVDEASGKHRAVIEIALDGARATGRIVEIFPEAGEDPHPLCEKCKGADHGRPIIGLPILALTADADGRGFHGTVLDPEEGHTYRCAVTLADGGRQLRLRGFLGLEVFGRTDTWYRAP